METILVIIGLLGTFFIFFVLLGIVFYILKAVGLYGMGKKAGIQESWLAFIPILNGFVWGNIIKEIKISNYVIPHAGIVIPVSSLLFYSFVTMNFLGSLLSLCAIIIQAAGLYQLYSLYKPNEATLYTVLSIIFMPIAIPLIFFSLRDKSPISLNEVKSA